jgi:hypothetical protein
VSVSLNDYAHAFNAADEPVRRYAQPGDVAPAPPTKDTKDTNPKDAAATTRLDLSLFPASARAYGALAMTEGDLKYGGYNYRTAGVQVSVYYAALNRHMDKFFNGEWADPKTRVPHLANALACVAVLIDAFEQGNVNDDRPPVQDTSGLLAGMEELVAHLQRIFPRRHARHRAAPAADGDGMIWDGTEWHHEAKGQAR